MSLEKDLHTRSNSTCEICGSTKDLSVFVVPPKLDANPDYNVLICSTCKTQIQEPEKTDANHWRCLNDCMWSEVPAVKIISWRMLNRLRNEGWPQDALEMLYLDEENLRWAKATGESTEDDGEEKHKDANGVVLIAGDTVVLIKDLDVKGANFTAKRGTSVRNIKLVDNNVGHIEGKVEGQQIVILTQFVKKSS